MGFLAIKNNDYIVDSSSIHNIVGMIVFTTCGLLTIGGMMTNYIRNTIKWNTSIISKARLSHQVILFYLIFFKVIWMACYMYSLSIYTFWSEHTL